MGSRSRLAPLGPFAEGSFAFFTAEGGRSECSMLAIRSRTNWHRLSYGLTQPRASPRLLEPTIRPDSWLLAPDTRATAGPRRSTSRCYLMNSSNNDDEADKH